MPIGIHLPEGRCALCRFLQGKQLHNRVVAALLVLACFTGLGLVVWHSVRTPWNVRATELDGIRWLNPLSSELEETLRAATTDWWIPVAGQVLLAAGGLLGWAVSAGRFAQRLAIAMAFTLVTLAGLCVAENELLKAAVNAAHSGAHLNTYALWLQGTAFLGYALLPIAGLVAVIGGVVTLSRGASAIIRRVATFIPVKVRDAAPVTRRPEATRDLTATLSSGDDAHWSDTAVLPRCRVPGGLGVCLSGGGIRSASFTLGALQALQMHPPLAPGQGGSELTRAKYLTAVSGGAYTAGALLLATEPPENEHSLQLSGTSHVSLPEGIVSGLHDFTIAAWVNPAAASARAPVFDFGDGPGNHMFLTVSAAGTPHFAIVDGNGNRQCLSASSPLPVNQWTHLAVTLSGAAGTLYMNGAAVAVGTRITLNPASLGSTTHNWIGKSQNRTDPYLNATVADFRIYDRALSTAEVQSLTTSACGTPGGGNVAWYRFGKAKDATVADSSGNRNHGTIESRDPGKPGAAGLKEAILDYDRVFQPGSPEFDHLRRHGSYIADGLREWAVAILVVARGALLTALFLGLITLVAGRWTGFLYHEINRSGDLASPWHAAWGAVFATAAVVALALLLWLMSTWSLLSAKARDGFAEAAKMTCVPAAVLVILGAVVPIVTWFSMGIVNSTGGAGPYATGTPAGGAAKGVGLGMTGFIAATLGLFWQRRAEIVKAAQKKARTWRTRLGDLGGRVMQWLAVYVGLAMVATVYLVIFGYSTYIAAETEPGASPEVGWGSPGWTIPLTNFWLTFSLTVLLCIAYLLVDETVIGMHPFYRRRLASAFAVRRNRCASQANHPSGYKADSYQWEEDTELETYGAPQRHGEKLKPQVIFCAAAHCSDPAETPPGRHVLPFTLSHDMVGGPEVGWCETRVLRDRMSHRLQKDLTVQTAMAVSGAAFASEGGAYRRPANLILALANARLGTWMANPEQMADPGRPWWQARPPRVRRLSYLVREIFGWYPKELPLMFVTDGSHYENLGLLELLRHRCTEIYCFDASSDTETFATSLGRSITLAYDELGVTVTPRHPERADPRTDETNVEASDLRGRLATASVITADVAYPAQRPGDDPVPGVLVIGRATLDPDTPWEIRRHAAAHPLFPHDATGDQWFDDRKFNAYTGLGRHVGQQAIKAMRTACTRPPGPQPFGRHATRMPGLTEPDGRDRRRTAA